MLDRFRVAFNTLWEDEHVSRYDKDEFKKALAAATDRPQAGDAPALMLDISPYPFQRAILEKLDAERHRHDRWQNLVVAATGTGKTIIAALDYQRLRMQLGGDASLLFVAHRGEILRQSQQVFQNATRLPAFGEIYVGGERPDKWRHVFASVQSLKNVDLSELPSDHFDVVIIDEFHHAAASTYERILEHFKPKVLLGLTATPERADGKDILRWFGGRMAAEIRLWEALDKSLLAPFHYFGINDGTDLSAVKWRSSGYDTGELEKLYTADDARVVRVLQQVERLVTDIRGMKALGFCVSVEHARFMARRFSERGIPSVSVDGSTPREERDQALSSLLLGDINCIFSVDVFNEGVDLPSVDTILMLRPTESATIFLQQLGRGLRRSEGKSVCTVLDFIGNQRKEFRFAERYVGMLGGTRKSVTQGIEEGFPRLPTGVHFELDRITRDHVLANLKASVRNKTTDLVAELRQLGPDVTLSTFLEETGRDVRDVFRSPKGDPGWETLRELAGFPSARATPHDFRLLRAIPRLLHIDDEERLAFYKSVLRRTSAPSLSELTDRQLRMLEMLHLTLWGDYRKTALPLAEGLASLFHAERITRDLAAVMTVLDQRAPMVTLSESALPEYVPLRVHGTYSSAEILAALGASTPEAPRRLREGVMFRPELAADFFFVTAQSPGNRFSPSISYKNYPLSDSLVHLETQSRENSQTGAGYRYMHHRALGTSVHLFYRGATGTSAVKALPYVYLGPADYVTHQGERPLGITWKLRAPMPQSVAASSGSAAVG